MSHIMVESRLPSVAVDASLTSSRQSLEVVLIQCSFCTVVMAMRSCAHSSSVLVISKLCCVVSQSVVAVDSWGVNDEDEGISSDGNKSEVIIDKPLVVSAHCWMASML